MPRRLAIALLLLPAALAAAAPRPSPPAASVTERAEAIAEQRRRASELAGVALRAFAAGDFARARDALLEQTEADPDEFTAWYNLACAEAALDHLDAAEAALTKAIEKGFDDVHQLRRDDHLAALRGRDLYRDLLDHWPAVLEARRNANLKRDEPLAGRRSERRTLDHLRLEIISAHDPVATDAAVTELTTLADWYLARVFLGVDTEPWQSHHPWVDVVLPDPKSFRDWQLLAFGPDSTRGFTAIGGAYDHDRKRLVCRDLGATLRHEFVHTLHWRDMTRRGQRHAMWVQEGLASLAEDYDPGESGSPVFVPSWRTNMLKRLLDAHALPTLAELTATPLGRFNASKPLAKYAHARAVFLYLLDRDRLTEFYAAYAATYETDPTGLAALRAAAGFEDQDALEADFRRWVGALPDVPETGSDLAATLGIEIEEGTGDGPKVVNLPAGARARTGLRLGSIITAINGRPTRDLSELIRVLGTYAPGDTVTLSARRGRVHTAHEVELLPRE